MSSGFPRLRDAAESARSWLLSDAASVWSERGRTPAGLFAERISLAGKPDDSWFRVFVQARNIFSFATMGRMGWEGPWKQLIGHTMDTLMERAKRRDGLFVHSLRSDASVLDGRADLYDQAFVLFAMGTAGEALARPELYDEAEVLLDTVEREWSHPKGGFREGEIADDSLRRQNPHMHLLEALLALADASGRRRFHDAALEIANLASSRFIDPRTGALLEYFTNDWTPAERTSGQIVEPGHCFEWAWLFERLSKLGWYEGSTISDRLTDFARRYGVDAAREVTLNEVLTNGSLHDGRARLWPQTERLKAAIARFVRLQSQEEADEAVAAAKGLWKYLDVPLKGLWHDKLLEDGRWVDELAPGSSLYHITCAYAELAAVADQPGSQAQ